MDQTRTQALYLGSAGKEPGYEVVCGSVLNRGLSPTPYICCVYWDNGSLSSGDTGWCCGVIPMITNQFCFVIRMLQLAVTCLG